MLTSHASAGKDLSIINQVYLKRVLHNQPFASLHKQKMSKVNLKMASLDGEEKKGLAD
jgi:hypothetical protein